MKTAGLLSHHTFMVTMNVKYAIKTMNECQLSIKVNQKTDDILHLYHFYHQHLIVHPRIRLGPCQLQGSQFLSQGSYTTAKNHNNKKYLIRIKFLEIKEQNSKIILTLCVALILRFKISSLLHKKVFWPVVNKLF